jgi:transcriptional regulator with GAF, ATPase, and Fis domain
MEFILESFNRNNPVANRIEALKTLTKLLLHEVESLSEISPPKHRQTTETGINLSDKVQQYEVELICNAMLAANGNQRQAAKMLGMKTTTLHAKIKRYEIDSLSVAGQFQENKNDSESD